MWTLMLFMLAPKDDLFYSLVVDYYSNTNESFDI